MSHVRDSRITRLFAGWFSREQRHHRTSPPHRSSPTIPAPRPRSGGILPQLFTHKIAIDMWYDRDVWSLEPRNRGWYRAPDGLVFMVTDVIKGEQNWEILMTTEAGEHKIYRFPAPDEATLVWAYLQVRVNNPAERTDRQKRTARVA